jgi:anti-repressor protein
MNLVPYQFEGSQIRVVDRNGAPHFVATDVARALGYTNPSKAIHDHCRGERIVTPLRTAGGEQQVRLIAEPDLYRLIVGSHLPAAQQFERWVFEVVIPEARRRAAPAAPQHAIPRSLPEALRMAADLAEANAGLQAVIAKQAPKIEALDRIATADGAMCLTNAAKHLQVPPRTFIAWLQANAWVFRRGTVLVPLQHRIDQGYMVMKVGVRRVEVGGVVAERAYEQALITARGLARLARVLASREDATAERAIGECAQALA